MKICNKCNEEKPLTDFYKESRQKDGLNRSCKICYKLRIAGKQYTTAWRIRLKENLVEHFGGRCYDCKNTFPPFYFDFDHRDPSEKEFGLASSLRANTKEIFAEAEKCDLVCANCHRMRTHKQRCAGCHYCS